MIAIAALLTLFAVSVLYRWLTEQRLRRSIGLPGPVGYPLVGCALTVDRRRPYETFSRWSRQFGDAYGFMMFGQPIIVISSVTTLREVLVTRGQDYAGRPKKFRAAFMGDNGNDIVSASISPSWLALKKVVLREMSRFDPGQNRLEALTMNTVEDLTHNFSSHAGRAFDPRAYVYDAIMNTICIFLTGEKLGATELDQFKRLERLITTSMNVGGEGSELDLLPWLRFLGNKTFRKLKEAKLVRDELYAWTKERVESDLHRDGRSSEGVMHGLFTRFRSGKAPELTENRLKLTIVNLLIGGSASTTSYLYLLLNVLVRNPAVQANIKREIDETVGSKPVRLSDRESMPYIRATLIELLRYGSLSPLLIPHMTVVDTWLKDVFVPKGVWIFPNVQALHHDETFWKDPYVFRPERFLDAAAETYQLLPSDDEIRKHVLSFSGGPRSCPGEAMAWSRLFLFLVTIVQRFQLEPSGSFDEQVPCDPRTFDLGLVLSPQSFQFKCIPRVNDDKMGDISL